MIGNFLDSRCCTLVSKRFRLQYTSTRLGVHLWSLCIFDISALLGSTYRDVDIAWGTFCRVGQHYCRNSSVFFNHHFSFRDYCAVHWSDL